MDENLRRDSLARALFQHLSEKHDKNDPLGSLARTVLNGEANLYEAAQFSWHADGLAKAIATSLEGLEKISAEQCAAFNREATQYRERLEEPHNANGGATQ